MTISLITFDLKQITENDTQISFMSPNLNSYRMYLVRANFTYSWGFIPLIFMGLKFVARNLFMFCVIVFHSL